MAVVASLAICTSLNMFTFITFRFLNTDLVFAGWGARRAPMVQFCHWRSAQQKYRPNIFTLIAMASLCSRMRCFQTLRGMLGDALFLHVAIYAPASCQDGLSEWEEDCMAKLFQRCIHEHHWLASHIGRRHASTKVSGDALATAMAQSYQGISVLLDADGVYALFALCGSTVNHIAQVNISEIEGVDVELLHSDSDVDGDELPQTPLSCALAFQDNEVVRFLLRRNADPNGYQWRKFDDEGEPIEWISPLYQAVKLYRPDFVDMLLRARANPDDWG